MAEREGFEPSIRLTVYTISNRAPSTARPPLLKPEKNPKLLRLSISG